MQAGELLAGLDHEALDCILLGHLSERNNSDAAALGTVLEHLDARHERVAVLAQHRCSEWFAVGGAARAEPERPRVTRLPASAATPAAAALPAERRAARRA